MNTNNLSLCIRGELPSAEELLRLLGTAPTSLSRRGQRYGSLEQPVDAWVLNLVPREDDCRPDFFGAQAAPVLRGLAPALASLDRSKCLVELRVSTILHKDQGGFRLSPDLLAAAAEAKAELAVSLLVLFVDEDEDESNSDLDGS